MIRSDTAVKRSISGTVSFQERNVTGRWTGNGDKRRGVQTQRKTILARKSDWIEILFSGENKQAGIKRPRGPLIANQLSCVIYWWSLGPPEILTQKKCYHFIFTKAVVSLARRHLGTTTKAGHFQQRTASWPSYPHALPGWFANQVALR